MSANPVEALAKVLEKIRNTWVDDHHFLTILEDIDKRLTVIHEGLRQEKDKEHTLPQGYGEDVLDVVESMLSFASRHWMHDEGQNTEGFALRVKKAYLKEKDYWEGCIASLKKELAESKGEKSNDQN